jgi:hypothetical protein
VTLTLRRASGSRVYGAWDDDDFDVCDGEREIGRKSYGTVESLGEAKEAFKGEYERWP